MESVNVKTNCPSPETLQQLIDGTVSDVTQLEEHLQTCKLCQDALDGLSQSDVLQPFLKDGAYHEDINQYLFLDEPQRDGDLGSIAGLFIEAEIGRGGAGIVFRGFDPDLSRAVAVKVLNNDGSFRSEARFERESKIAARIRSDYVVNVHAIGKTHDARPYIVMPLIEGPSLKATLAKQVPHERRSAEIVGQIATGLKSLHEAGIVHRDIKPANILMDPDDGRAKLTDFGLARETMSGATLTQADVLCGTPEYMSPEQSSGKETTPLSDIYSLGVTLYECLTGTTPFRGGALNILQQHCNVDPMRPRQINPRISKALETICLKAIAKEPARRYQSVAQFGDDLQRFLDGLSISARETPWWEKLYLWSRRNPRVATLSAVSAALLLTIGIGSSVAAWNLNQANIEINSEKQKATEAQQRAVQDRTAAVNALTNLVDSLYDDLSDNAATIKTREKIVDAAMQGLQSVTQVDGEDAADRTAFLAHWRMGDLLALQGKSERAEASYKTAIAICRQLVDQRPDSEASQLDLALAISQLGTLYRVSGNPKADECCTESEQILTALLEKNPNNREALAKLVVENGNRIELIRISNVLNTQAVIDYADSVFPNIERLFQQENVDPLACQAAYSICFLVGRSHLEAGRSYQARDYFDSAREYLDGAIEQKPNQTRLRSASAVLDRAHAMVSGSIGENDRSLELFQRSVDSFKELSAANPDDYAIQQQIANTQSLMSAALFADGRNDDAIQVVNDAAEIYLGLIETVPNKGFIRILYNEGQLRIAMFQLSIGRWNDSHQTSKQVLENLESHDFGRANAMSVMQYKFQARKLLEASQWLIGETPAKTTVAGKLTAILAATREDSLAATDLSIGPETTAVMDRIDPDFDGQTLEDLFSMAYEKTKDSRLLTLQTKASELGTYAHIARNCAQKADENFRELSTTAISHCIDLLTSYSFTAENIFANADLKWFRNTPQFAEIEDDLRESWIGKTQ